MRFFGVLFLALPLVAQHADRSEQKKNPAIGDPKAIAAGKGLFATSCAGCHGPTGEGGRGPNLHERIAWGDPLEDHALFMTIQNGIPGSDMPPTKLPESQVWQITAFVRSLTAPAIDVLPAGDPVAGEALYRGKGGCINCHRILGRGGMMGPDLSNIGAMRSAEKLREAIVDPDADGFRNYKGITVVTKDGRTIQGVARNRTNYSVQVIDQKGNVHLLQTADLREMKLSEHSPMPGDYKQKLTGQEITDLVAYLARQTIRPPEAKTSESAEKK
jgi:putative heme-binding domain-containing protein